MKQAGVVVQRPQQGGPATMDSRDRYAVAPNLLARQFDVAEPDHVWIGDISYVWTAEGWLYVSTLLGLSSCKGVGWAVSRRIDTPWRSRRWPGSHDLLGRNSAGLCQAQSPPRATYRPGPLGGERGGQQA
jgi:transposase InsO family protein